MHACGLIVWAALALAAQTYSWQTSIGAPGRVLRLADTVKSLGPTVAVMPSALVEYSSDGISHIWANEPSDPLRFREVYDASGAFLHWAAVDLADACVKGFELRANRLTVIASPGQDPAHLGLPFRVMMPHVNQGLVVADLDLQTGVARLVRYDYFGTFLSQASHDGSSPGPWNWIFSLAGAAAQPYLFAYAGDGVSGQSWIEQRDMQTGAQLFMGPVFPEADIRPLAWAPRSIHIDRKKLYVLASPNGPDTLSLLVYSTETGDLLARRDDLRSIIAEPFVRFESFCGYFGLAGRWPGIPSRPATIYELDLDTLDIQPRLSQTPGPEMGWWQPSGLVAHQDGSFIISDTGNTRLMWYTPSLALSRQVVTPFRPGAIQEAADGRIYVLNLSLEDDPGYAGVQVYSADGQRIGQFGNYGSGAGELIRPAAIAIDSAGNVYVADEGNNRVQVYDSAGAPLLSFGGTGIPPDGLQSPNAIAVAGSTVFVAEPLHAASRISLWTLTGQFLTYWFCPEVVTYLAPAPGGLLAAATRSGRVILYKTNGQTAGSFGEPGSGERQLSLPVAVSFAGDQAWVLDREKCCVQVYQSGPPQPSITAAIPSLVGQDPAVTLHIYGTDLPAPTSVALVTEGQTISAIRIQRYDSGHIRADFNLQTAQPGSYDVVIGYDGGQVQLAGAVTVAYGLDLQLVGRWQLTHSGPPGDLQPVSQAVFLTINPDRTCRRDFEAAGGNFQSGWAATDGSSLCLNFASASSPALLDARRYSYTISGDELYVEPAEGTGAQAQRYRRVAAPNLIDPDLRGVWRLVDLEESGAPVAVTWQEFLVISQSGAFATASNRGGQWDCRAGIMSALSSHLQRQITHSTDPSTLCESLSGSYDLSENQLVLSFSQPRQVVETWQRQYGPADLPAVFLGFLPPDYLCRGGSHQLRILAANLSPTPAQRVEVSVQTPVVGGGQLTRIALMENLQPDETRWATLQLQVPADYPSDALPVLVTAGVDGRYVLSCSRDIPVRDAVLDIGLSLHIPPRAVRWVRFQLRLTIYNRGCDLAALIPPGNRDQVAIEAPIPAGMSYFGTEGGQCTVAGGYFRMTWQQLIDSLAGASQVTLVSTFRPDLPPAEGDGYPWRFTAFDAPGLPDARPSDNAASAWQQYDPDAPYLMVETTPPASVRPGGRLLVTITLRNTTDTNWWHQTVLMSVPPELDISTAEVSEEGQIDTASRLITWSPPSLPLGQTQTMTASFRLSSGLPVGHTFSVQITLLATQPEIFASQTVNLRVGTLFGDFDESGAVDVLDLLLFRRGWLANLAGLYDPAFDIAPYTGTWPDPIPQPDSQIGHSDAQAAIEAFLRGQQ